MSLETASSKCISSLVTVGVILFVAQSMGWVAARHCDDYTFLFLLASIFLGFLVLLSDIVPLVAILLILSFADSAVELALLPPQVMWAPELLSGLLFAKAMAKRAAARQKLNLFGVHIWIGFFAVAAISLVRGNLSPVSALLFLRLLFRYYLLFLAIINLELDDRSMKRVNAVLVFIFVIQIPLSVTKLLVYGQGETPLALNSHSLPVTISLIGIGYLLAYYLFFKRSIGYLLLSLGFVGLSIVGGKRAFIFFLPVLLVGMGWFVKDRVRNLFGYATVAGLLFLVCAYACSRLIPTLNPDRQVGGKFSLSHAIGYAGSYTLSSNPVNGNAAGRTSATAAVFTALRNRGLLSLGVGLGPGCILKSAFGSHDRREAGKVEYGVEYGWTGLNWLGIQVGYLGAIMYFLFFCLTLRESLYCFRHDTDPYWCSFGLGMATFSFIVLVINLAYMAEVKNDAISAFYFCLAGFAVIRAERLREQSANLKIDGAPPPNHG